jgi:serine/threonine protein kinase
MSTGQRTYICEKIIGTGEFAIVFRADHRVATVQVAIKLVDQDQIDSEVRQTNATREISLLRQMNHPFSAGQFQNIAIVRECAPHGILLNFFTTPRALPETLIKKYSFFEILSVDGKLISKLKISYLRILDLIKVINVVVVRAFAKSNHHFSRRCLESWNYPLCTCTRSIPFFHEHFVA